ncbi:hypothetical protein BHM03_00004664 [Ensete ventricosum]|nr:hypothetical protein BHM03_00004664 [Ensete ventricosum]
MLDELFREPQTVECVRHVNKVAEFNWQCYASPEIKEMNGHLMRYPVKVERDGRVGPLPGHENFPDVGGKILGAHSTLPDTHFTWYQVEGSFGVYALYLNETFDGGTKMTRLTEAELGSEGLSMRRENTETGTLEEYASVLPFKLLRRKWCIVKIMLRGRGL